MFKRDAILKLEHIQWAFERHTEAKMPSDLELTDEFMQLLTERIRELVTVIERISPDT